MPKLNEDIKARIIADWKVGISQNQLGKNYSLSPTTVNKLVRGIPQENIDLVDTQVALTLSLQEKSGYEITSIEREANKKLRRQNLVYGNAEKLANKISILTEAISNASELKALSEANMIIGKSLGVIDQFAKNGDVNVQTNVGIQSITRRIVD